jgi:hypothetical protein
MRRRAPDQLTRLHEWAVTTAARRGRNKATIAIANELARIVWPSGGQERYFTRGPG